MEQVFNLRKCQEDICSAIISLSELVLVVKNPPANAGDVRDVGLIPRWGRSPSRDWGLPCNPLQYSCLENPMDREAWWAIVHRVTKIQTQMEQHMHAICHY